MGRTAFIVAAASLALPSGAIATGLDGNSTEASKKSCEAKDRAAIDLRSTHKAPRPAPKRYILM